MHENLKFDDETDKESEVTETSEPPQKKKSPPKKLVYEPDDGEEIPDGDTPESGGTNINANPDNPADVADSKLYERESSLKVNKKAEKPYMPKSKPIRNQSGFYEAVTAGTDEKEKLPDIDIPEYDPVDNDISEVEPDGNVETPKPETDTDANESVDDETVDTPDVPDKPDNKPKPKREEQQNAKQDKKISKLEQQRDKYGKKRDNARNKQPSKNQKVRGNYFDESKNKAKTKIRFDKDPIPIDEAKWNLPKKQSFPAKGVTVITSAGVNKLHTKVYEAEHDNVGTEAAHRGELVGESVYRGGKKLIHETNRRIKNKPYRQAAKYETKSVKTQMKLDYQKALKDNPKMKSNPLSRVMQKQKIKRQYADAIRKAKKSGETVKKTGDIVTKTTQAVAKTIRRNPIVILTAGILFIIILGIMSLFTTCMSIFAGSSGVLGAASYTAADGDIDKAELLYTELETDLRLEISNAETANPGYDEYRYNVGNIGHDPLELMAFLTAVYQDFKYDDIESVLRELFDEQYNLEFVPETEIRTRTETGAETTTDEETTTGEDSSEEEYEEEAEYEWTILNINLTSVSLMEVILPRMNTDQIQQFFILMQTKGARQYAGNPFNVNWIPYVTSYYGYRIHPVTGEKNYHKGIDIGLPAGTSIRAGIAGTVTAADFDDEYGNYIVISDGKGLEMKYAHCDTLIFSVGQTVTKGDVIATVGNTGTSTGAHLHMEILKDSQYLNPIYFVESN